MPWIIGIDEAGYGPNLGPLVMTSVACRVGEDMVAADLWQVLRGAVRRHGSKADDRLLIEDSKLVYSATRGLLDLEVGVLAALSPRRGGRVLTTGQFLEWVCPAHEPELGAELWYSGKSRLPAVADPVEVRAAATRFDRCCKKEQVFWGPVRSVVMCPSRFNHLLDHWGSKGGVLAEGLAELVACNRDVARKDERLFFFIDKHGGRNNYSAILQRAIADGFVVAQEEGLDQSVYRVLGLEHDIHVAIEPRADGNHFCVALASMVSKYVREVLMSEFNRFWQEQVPELKATAGYPGDADRFYAAIRPALQRLGLPEEVVWRRK